MEFFRDARIVKKLKAAGKRIVCYYIGTDLRDRGVIPEIDALSDLNITTEFDHLKLAPGSEVRLPALRGLRLQPQADREPAPEDLPRPAQQVLQGHRPDDRGRTEMERKHGVEFVLIEGRPHAEAMEIKQTCDIAIDQITDIGGTGYGVNSLETLSMGIPTLTSFTPDFEAFLSDHPFIVVTADDLPQKLEQVILNGDLRRRKAAEGRRFVEKHHDAETVTRGIYAIYRELGWVDERGDFVPARARSWQPR